MTLPAYWCRECMWSMYVGHKCLLPLSWLSFLNFTTHLRIYTEKIEWVYGGQVWSHDITIKFNFESLLKHIHLQALLMVLQFLANSNLCWCFQVTLSLLITYWVFIIVLFTLIINSNNCSADCVAGRCICARNFNQKQDIMRLIFSPSNVLHL